VGRPNVPALFAYVIRFRQESPLVAAVRA